MNCWWARDAISRGGRGRGWARGSPCGGRGARKIAALNAGFGNRPQGEFVGDDLIVGRVLGQERTCPVQEFGGRVTPWLVPSVRGRRGGEGDCHYGRRKDDTRQDHLPVTAKGLRGTQRRVAVEPVGRAVGGMWTADWVRFPRTFNFPRTPF